LSKIKENEESTGSNHVYSLNRLDKFTNDNKENKKNYMF